jgi:bacterioferritin-associated ferredoxin
MLACLCRAVSDKKVLAVIQEGAETVEEVTQACGAGGDCGACKQLLQTMIDAVEMECGGCRRAPPPVDAAA